MTYDAVEYEKREATAWISLDRPEALNALNEQLLTDLEAAIRAADADDEVRAAVVRGNGRAFSSGYDISEAEPEVSVDEGIHRQRTHIETIFSARLPVIAAVDGAAVAGGCNVAIACDLTFATESAEFGYPDMHFGEPTPKLVLPFVTDSLKHARELLYSGKTVDAAAAERMGLVNRVVPDGELHEAVEAEIEQIRKTPSTAVTITKDLLNDVQETQGFRRYGRIDEYLGSLTMETETAKKFRQMRDEEGLQAALEWMHETDKP
jgi:enoyl-CoA hydratase